MTKKRKLTKEQAKAFLATPRGQEWLATKIEERRARQRRGGGFVPVRLRRTKLPFSATINGHRCEVSRFAGTLLFDYEESA